MLLLDEPLSNLDAKLRASTGLELKRLQRRLGITTVFVTHDQEEAMTIADRLAVLDQGVIQQVGTPRELYDAPVEPVRRRVRRLDQPLRRARRAGGPAGHLRGGHRRPRPRRVPAGRIARATGVRGAAIPGATVAVAFRPHAVRLAGSGPGDGLAFDAEDRHDRVPRRVRPARADGRRLCASSPTCRTRASPRRRRRARGSVSSSRPARSWFWPTSRPDASRGRRRGRARPDFRLPWHGAWSGSMRRGASSVDWRDEAERDVPAMRSNA